MPLKRENWFGLSVTLNVILCGALVFFAISNPASSGNGALTTENSHNPSQTKRSGGDLHQPTADSTSTGGETATEWERWLPQLRAMGMPDNLLAGMVMSDFDSRWQKQLQELQNKYENGEVGDTAIEEFNNRYDGEAEKEIQSALGEEGFRHWEQKKVLHDLNFDKLNLTGLESDTLYQLQKNLTQRQHDLDMALQKGKIDRAEFDSQQTVTQNAYEQQVLAVLGNDRYSTLQNEESDSPELRRSLHSLHASDAQIQTVLQADQQWNQRRAELGQSGGGTPDQLQAIDVAKDQIYQQVLGANGYAELQKEQDNTYKTMKQYSSVWQLSNSDIDYLYNTIQAYQKNAQTYQQQAQDLEKQGQKIDWNAIQQNVQQTAQQTEQTLRNYLGEDRFNRLEQNNVIQLGDNNSDAPSK